MISFLRWFGRALFALLVLVLLAGAFVIVKFEGWKKEKLAELDAGRPPKGLDEEKRRLTAVALRLRRERPEWFGASAGYEPLTAWGEAAEHCVAFCRAGRVVTAVTRLPYGLQRAGGWRGTRLELPPGRWRELLTGREVGGVVRLAELFDAGPVALLRAE